MLPSEEEVELGDNLGMHCLFFISFDADGKLSLILFEGQKELIESWEDFVLAGTYILFFQFISRFFNLFEGVMKGLGNCLL